MSGEPERASFKGEVREREVLHVLQPSHQTPQSEACIFLQSVNVLRNINYAKGLGIGCAKRSWESSCHGIRSRLQRKPGRPLHQDGNAEGCSGREPRTSRSLPLIRATCKAAMGGMGGMQESVVGT